jgi:Flp pilus assembly protein TadD
MTRGAGVFVFFALGAVACGAGGAKAVTGMQGGAPVQVVLASPAAVGKMVQGVQAAKDGQRDRATSALREAIQIDANLWEAHYDLGVMLATGGDLAGAELELSSAAKLAADSQQVAVALAEVRRRRGEHRLAAEGLTDFVRAHPNAVDARTLYVAALRDSGQIERAIAEAREVLVRKPGDAIALAELALSHLAKGEKETAELLAKQAVDANPNSAVTHRAMGLLDLAKGDDAIALTEFRKASQADPRDTTSRQNMGVVLLRAGAYAKAEEQYREILKVSPDDHGAEVGLAAALRGQGDAQHPQRFEEARTLLDRVLAGDAHDTSALFNMGVLYADFFKNAPQAAPYFKRFLADAPSDHPLRAEADKYVSAASASAPSPPLPQAPAAPPPATASPKSPAKPSAGRR